MPTRSRPAGSCSQGERHKLWEVPLWSVADENGQPIASMDPPGNAYDNYKREASLVGLFCYLAVQGGHARREGMSKGCGAARADNTQLLGPVARALPAESVCLLTCCCARLQLDRRLAGNRAPLGMFFHAGGWG